jgi:sulfite reductase (NADPH) flavoprotein alpha-component
MVFDGSSFVQQQGKRGYVDKVMLEEAQALWDLLRPRHLGGKGAHLYVCGRSSFARTVEDALLRVFRKFGANEQLLYQLAAERRYHQDIFTTYTGSIQQAARSYDASELVLHNSPEQGYWMAISGRVYDVTSFAEMHPGGMRIIANNAGIDATRAYQYVMHDVNSEVDSLLGMMEIGVIRRLNFGNQWAVSIGPDGLFTYSLEDAFIAWIRYLYLITEMQNAVITDFSFMHDATTPGDSADDMPPLKLQLLIEAHRRIYDNFIGGLMGEDLDAIYRITIGLCKQDLHVLALRRILDEHQASGESSDALRVIQLMQTLHRMGQYQELEQVLMTVIAEDKRFFEELKQIIRQGVVLFERYEAQVMARSADALIEILSTAIDALIRFHGRLAALTQRSTYMLDAPIDYKPETPYIGHGAASLQFSSGQNSEQE